jgi:serine/threonine protein kinase
MTSPQSASEHPEQADDALGDELDRHLQARRSTASTLGSSTRPSTREAEALRTIVDRLHDLAVFLGEPALRDSTLDLARDETADYQPKPSGPATPPAKPIANDGRQRIGKYELVRPLGRGGQGAAHLAFDPDLQRHVVLKLYHTATTTAWRTQLMAEGRALARIRSPFVAQCYTVEEHEGTPYLVVEYIPGKSLFEKLQQGLPDRAWSVHVTRLLAGGLAAIHACGLLHRDLKPSNILLGDDGTPRLVDFGLATHLASDQLRSVSGTLAYMAPEQARGESERIDPRTDVYGLGAVLYEMLTGRPPHVGQTTKALLKAAKSGDVISVRQLNPEVPPAVEAVCMKCLAKDPSRRFASAGEFAATLAELDASDQSWFRRIENRVGKKTVRTALVLAAALLLSVPVGLWAVLRDPDSAMNQQSNGQAGKSTTDGEETKPVDRPLRNEFTIKVDMPGQRRDDAGKWLLVDGDSIAIQLEVARDSYVGVWYVDQAGDILQLFPNADDRDHLVRAGQPRLIPGNKRYSIQATPADGPEYIHVLASTRRWAPFVGEKEGAEGVYTAFKNPERRRSWEEGLGQLRGLKLVPKEGGDGEQVSASELIVPFVVTPREKKR